MEKAKKFYNISFYSMILSAIIFLVGNVIAMILYPHYSFTHNFFSDLGVRTTIKSPVTGSLIVKAQYPEIFNITLAVSGFLTIIYFLGIGFYILKNYKINLSSILLIISSISGLTLGPLCIGVAIYDAGTYYYTHVWCANNLMLFIGITSILWALGIILSSRETAYKQSKWWYIDPFFVIFITFVAWVLVFGIPNVFLLRDITPQTYQKLVALSVFPFYSTVAYRFLLIMKKE